ncbi:Uncharacterised protein [Kingella potus]|uniref:Uncharacterized protein n=1 Tax=Kingella potus TaxID=265175 RepID=A0A377R0Y6_9NEIS|nr:hypothetical protein [Kingella potus]UOP01209.1 hypothetical protein LVJ84_02635 [Kingella potus]STR00927.1 Uncharacterised protein [Kingella potus]
MFIARKIIASSLYQQLLAQLQQRTGMKMYPEYETTLAHRDSQCLARARLSEDDVMRLLATDAAPLLDFATRYYATFRDAPDEQEYPAGETPDPDDDDDSETIDLGQCPNTLLHHLILYYLLKHRPDDLLPYFQAIRMPYAEKFAREVAAVFHQTA